MYILVIVYVSGFCGTFLMLVALYSREVFLLPKVERFLYIFWLSFIYSFVWFVTLPVIIINAWRQK